MMKMSGRALSCCVFLFLSLGNGSAIKRLNSIRDLNETNFGQSVPRHSLILLRWFASVITIDNNGIIHPTFDLVREDYGSHHYGNFERLLNPPPPGYHYYTVGNINQDTTVRLPDDVVNSLLRYGAQNRNRIIIRVQRSLQIIDQVYLTQHYGSSEYKGTGYDPYHTYQITTNLLRELRQFPVGYNQPPPSGLRNQFGRIVYECQSRDIGNRWVDPPTRGKWCSDLILATLCLFFFLLIFILSIGEKR